MPAIWPPRGVDGEEPRPEVECPEPRAVAAHDVRLLPRLAGADGAGEEGAAVG